MEHVGISRDSTTTMNIESSRGKSRDSIHRLLRRPSKSNSDYHVPKETTPPDSDRDDDVVSSEATLPVASRGIKNNDLPTKNSGSSEPSFHQLNEGQSIQGNATPTTRAGSSEWGYDKNSLETAKAFGNQERQPDDVLDLVCIGMGPASLAIAIALADSYAKLPRERRRLPKILFLEKQGEFAWHAGMQLPEAKMQISFLKDLATPRDPTSPFSFINYLHSQGRFNTFINLGTFLPARMEYEDYMRWCAGHFEQSVEYGSEVHGVKPAPVGVNSSVTSRFSVEWRNTKSSKVEKVMARHVVIAAGGMPNIPKELKALTNGDSPRVVHSSQYVTTIRNIEERQSRRETSPQKLVVVGSGQSAAEIFNDLWDRYPQSEVTLLIRGGSLRPSDDSPFVNEIFDPDRVDGIYAQDPEERQKAIALDKATNYSVVRLTLLEHIYERLYHQRIRVPDATKRKAKIVTNRAVKAVEQNQDGSLRLKLAISGLNADKAAKNSTEEEFIDASQVFVATGYKRNQHEDFLKDTMGLLPERCEERLFPVGRDYKIQYDASKVAETCGVWLQGCNESTHGLSDTLLSILAIRGGEMVESIFGDELREAVK